MVHPNGISNKSSHAPGWVRYIRCGSFNMVGHEMSTSYNYRHTFRPCCTYVDPTTGANRTRTNSYAPVIFVSGDSVIHESIWRFSDFVDLWTEIRVRRQQRAGALRGAGAGGVVCPVPEIHGGMENTGAVCSACPRWVVQAAGPAVRPQTGPRLVGFSNGDRLVERRKSCAVCNEHLRQRLCFVPSIVF